MIGCPTCHADAGPPHRVLHHFLCAHVGPDYDYVSDGKVLVCPKCRRPLMTEREDYEVIGASYRCPACGREFAA